MLKDKYSNFKAPYIMKSDIQEAVTDFLNKFWKDNLTPIEIEEIVEFELGIQIIPLKNLLNEKGIDAFISKDFRFITIDEDIYFRDSNQSRRRFSLGHEVGHFVLHKKLYDKIKFTSEDEWIEFIETIPRHEYFFIEQHAYEFSGKLLVPKDQLIKSLKSASRKLKSSSFGNSLPDFDLIKGFVYSEIGREFLVSDGVIVRRINSEQIDVREIFEME